MAMKGLVGGDCGGSNPLLRLASHYTQDRGYTNEGLQGGKGLEYRIVNDINFPGGFRAGGDVDPGLSEAGLVREFLAETRTVTSRPPQTFRMDSLLQEMRDMETQSQRSLGAVPRQAPPVASLASSDDTWAAEFLETEQNVIDWSRDFLAEHTASLGGPDPVLVTPLSARPEDKWAEQYLEDVPSLLTESDAEAEQSLEESRQRTEAPPPHLDPQEFQDFIASVGRDSAVTGSEAAGSSLQDGNLKNRIVIECECGPHNRCDLDSAWAEEFVASQQFTQSDVRPGEERSETYKQVGKCSNGLSG